MARAGQVIRLAAARARTAVAVCAGSYVILRVALYVFGGWEHLLELANEKPHKLTALAILHGSLRLHPGVLGAEHDDQVHGGATFTNFGFGVPLLQAPFHALAHRLHWGTFFPDRLLFFLFLAALVPFLWGSLHRYLTAESGPLGAGAWFCTWGITLALVANSLFVLLSFRFIQYEEAIAYLVLCELAALGFYARFAASARVGWVYPLGVVAGIGLLVRSSGSVYVVLWAALALWRRRSWKVATAYASGVGPLVVTWLWTNWVKAGSALSLGYENTNVWQPQHYPMGRFANRCTDALPEILLKAQSVFEALFVRIGDAPPELAHCRFFFETRSGGEREPFFPSAVLVLLVASLVVYAVRRPRFVDVLFPHGALLGLFGTFVIAGIGFSYRYVGDLWPAVGAAATLLAAHVRLLERPVARGVVALLGVTTTMGLVLHDSIPHQRIEVLDRPAAEALATEAAAIARTPQPALPARIACGDPLPSWPVGDGLGLDRGCSVGTFTNLYLGVPPNPAGHALRFRVDRPGAPSVRVFVDGRLYVARREGDAYVTPLRVDDRRLFTPVVVVTIEWTSGLTPPTLRFVDVELT